MMLMVSFQASSRGKRQQIKRSSQSDFMSSISSDIRLAIHRTLSSHMTLYHRLGTEGTLDYAEGAESAKVPLRDPEDTSTWDP